MENIKMNIKWHKDKEEIWKEVFEPLMEHSKDRLPFVKRIPLWSYAAVFIVCILAAAFSYTITEISAKGEHKTVRLPDHSTARLNAESKIRYRPWGWIFFRNVTLDGEACFDVKPGSRFGVNFGNNKVNVLGTIFNVYARLDKYCVTCLTGKVEICAGRKTVMLNAGMQAAWNTKEWRVDKSETSTQTVGWINGKLKFVETPLSEVIEEIERQYNINVASGFDVNYLYTGNFSLTEKAEDVLEIIGKPFGVTFNIE